MAQTVNPQRFSLFSMHAVWRGGPETLNKHNYNHLLSDSNEDTYHAWACILQLLDDEVSTWFFGLYSSPSSQKLSTSKTSSFSLTTDPIFIVICSGSTWPVMESSVLLTSKLTTMNPEKEGASWIGILDHCRFVRRLSS